MPWGLCVRAASVGLREVTILYLPLCQCFKIEPRVRRYHCEVCIFVARIGNEVKGLEKDAQTSVARGLPLRRKDYTNLK